MRHGNYTTATAIKYYWICPALFGLIYLKNKKPIQSAGQKLGEVQHNILLGTMQELKGIEHPELEDYRKILRKKTHEFGHGRPYSDVVDNFRKDLSDFTIFDRMDLPVSEIHRMEIEESYYIHDEKIYGLKLHSRADILYNGDGLKLYDLKTGPFPENGVFPEDCISTVASAIPVEQKFKQTPQAFVIYIKAMDRAREINYGEWVNEVKGCISGIKKGMFPKKKNPRYCSNCSCEET
jgi:CRISPR/Cas system-associated exonuclease Cas4 (RecB family)